MYWDELNKAIDNSPVAPPCTNFPDLFFGDLTTGTAHADTRMAKKMCQRCPIINDCLTYALRANEHDGVWGGTTSIERKNLRKKHGTTQRALAAIEGRSNGPKTGRLQTDSRETL